MIFLKKYYVNSTEGVDCIGITHEVKYCIRDSTIPAGVATVIVPEGGAGVLIVEPLPAVLDGLKALWKGWQGEGTLEATTNDSKKRDVAVLPRVLGASIGASLQIPFVDGQLVIAPYTEVMVIDFDPVRRRREIVVQIMGEQPQAQANAPGGGVPRKGPRG